MDGVSILDDQLKHRISATGRQKGNHFTYITQLGTEAQCRDPALPSKWLGEEESGVDHGV